MGKYSNELTSLHLVKTYCLPTLLFDCEIWNLSDRSMHKLNVPWNNCFRYIFRGFCVPPSCLAFRLPCFVVCVVDTLISDVRPGGVMSDWRWVCRGGAAGKVVIAVSNRGRHPSSSGWSSHRALAHIYRHVGHYGTIQCNVLETSRNHAFNTHVIGRRHGCRARIGCCRKRVGT